MELVGSGDPTGCGEGFSFNRIPLKSTFHKRWLGAITTSNLSSCEPHANIKYSIAEQQQAYREQIMKIWDAQYNSLSSNNEIASFNGVTAEESQYEARSANINSEEGVEDADDSSSVNTAASFSGKAAPADPYETSNKARSFSSYSKYLIIKRKIPIPDDPSSTFTQTEIIRDPRVIMAYLEERLLIEKKASGRGPLTITTSM